MKVESGEHLGLELRVMTRNNCYRLTSDHRLRVDLPGRPSRQRPSNPFGKSEAQPMDGMNSNSYSSGPDLDTRAADREAIWTSVRMTLAMAALLVVSVLAWTAAYPTAATPEVVPLMPASVVTALP
jgi:hypothetical protein